jgi:hypothetical protein
MEVKTILQYHTKNSETKKNTNLPRWLDQVPVL